MVAIRSLVILTLATAVSQSFGRFTYSLLFMSGSLPTIEVLDQLALGS